jgi:hypothetical protein
MYYCPVCNKDADEITEIYYEVKEYRKWDNNNYELVDSSLDEADKIVCTKCGTEVEGCSDE